LFRRPLIEQVSQGRSTATMHSRAESHLDLLQVQLPGFAPFGKDDPQEALYLALDLPLDRFGRFFSCGLSPSSSTGRRRQIFSFTSTKA
jgi:hypothetical protein